MIDASFGAHGTRHRSGGVPDRCRATVSLTAALPRYPPESQRDAQHRDRCHGASGAQQCSLLGHQARALGGLQASAARFLPGHPGMGTTITSVPLRHCVRLCCGLSRSLKPCRNLGDQNPEPYVTLADPTTVIIFVAADYRSVPTAAPLPWAALSSSPEACMHIGCSPALMLRVRGQPATHRDCSQALGQLALP